MEFSAHDQPPLWLNTLEEIEALQSGVAFLTGFPWKLGFNFNASINWRIIRSEGLMSGLLVSSGS
jgi:hypothetical protein